MKKLLSFIAAIAMCATTCNAQSSAASADTMAYCIGATMGKLMYEKTPQDFNKDVFLRAFEQTLTTSNDSSALAGHFMATLVASLISNAQKQYGLNIDAGRIVTEMKKALDDDPISDEELTVLDAKIKEIENRLKQEQLDALAKSPEAIANKQAGDRFIARKLMSKKYIRCESGLMYRVIKEGYGDNLDPDRGYFITYKGSLIDGTVVEYEPDGREVFPNQVTPGCGEMLCLMSPGMKVEAIIPSDIAYGLEGNPNRGIGPNQTLVFVIEVLDDDSNATEHEQG